MSRSWRLKILQYECGSPVLAPEGCLQHYTGISGNVSSFNWKTEDNAVDSSYPNQVRDSNGISRQQLAATPTRCPASATTSACGGRAATAPWSGAPPRPTQVTSAIYNPITNCGNLCHVPGIGDFSVSDALLTASATATDAKNRDANCMTDYVMIPQVVMMMMLMMMMMMMMMAGI